MKRLMHATVACGVCVAAAAANDWENPGVFAEGRLQPCSTAVTADGDALRAEYRLPDAGRYSYSFRIVPVK